jgi:hypothetical protein
MHHLCLKPHVPRSFRDPVEVGYPDGDRFGPRTDCEVDKGAEEVSGVLFPRLEPGDLELFLVPRRRERPAGADLPEGAPSSGGLQIADGEPSECPVDADETARRSSEFSDGPRDVGRLRLG